MDEKIRKEFFKFRDNIQHKWEDFESILLDKYDAEAQDIINIRKMFFSFLLEMFCSWQFIGDSVPDFVKVGARTNKGLKIELIDF